MVAKQEMDKGISTLAGSQFNYNGGAVSEISLDTARSLLDFTIEKRPSRTEEGLIIPRQHYLRRSDGGIVDANCSVGDEFEVTAQPHELVTFAEYIMSKIPSVKIETCASMYNGGTCFLVLSNGGTWLVKGDTSPHYSSVIIANPLSRGKVAMVSTQFRVVCQNSLNAGMKSGQGYRIAHTTNARYMMEKALEGMRYELTRAEETRKACEFLASRSISVNEVNTLLNVIYPLPVLKEGQNTAGLTRMQTKRDEVIRQFESDNTFTDKSYYAFLNSLTFLEEHPLHKQNRTDPVQVAYENITGGRAESKANWLKACLVLANGRTPTPLTIEDNSIVDADFRMVA